MTASYAEQYAATLDAAAPLARALVARCCDCYDPDLVEFYGSEPCTAHKLLDLLEGPQQP